MFPTYEISDIKNFYKRGESDIFTGLWSILITTSAEQSEHFAKTHFLNFNEVSSNQWHLGVCARPEQLIGNNTESGVQWRADSLRQQVSDAIRRDLKKANIILPKLCIVFFDPNASEFYQNGFLNSGLPRDNYSETVVVIELNEEKIHDKEFYKRGFIINNEQIIKSIKQKNIDHYQRVSPEIYSDVLLNLDANLKEAKLKSYAKRILVTTGVALWGNYLSKSGLF